MAQPPKIQIDAVARHDLSETFADSVTSINFDGQTWRFEFAVTRMEQPIPPNTLKGKQVPVCRLVMTPKAGFDLHAKLSQILSAMEKQGVIKKSDPTPTPPVASLHVLCARGGERVASKPLIPQAVTIPL